MKNIVKVKCFLKVIFNMTFPTPSMLEADEFLYISVHPPLLYKWRTSYSHCMHIFLHQGQLSPLEIFYWVNFRNNNRHVCFQNNIRKVINLGDVVFSSHSLSWVTLLSYIFVTFSQTSSLVIDKIFSIKPFGNTFPLLGKL